MATIIGISGKIGSGKDYLTGKLIGELQRIGFTTMHTSFATPLKAELDEIIAIIRSHRSQSDTELSQIIASSMKMEIDDADRLIHFLKAEVTGNLELDAYSRTLGIRTALQDLGTKIRRRQQANYWTEKFVDFVNHADTDFIFTSDARFPNEMDTVVDNNGVALRLNISMEALEKRRTGRDGIVYTQEQLDHISETSLDDYPRFNFLVGESFDEIQLTEAILKKAQRFQEALQKMSTPFAENTEKNNLNQEQTPTMLPSGENLSRFPKGTGIAMETGYKDIERVKVGDFILTKDGSHQEVTKMMERSVSSSATLFAFGWDASTSTPNNSYYVKPSKLEHPRWVAAEKIQKGWYVSHPLVKLSEDSISEQDMKLAYLAGVMVQCSTSTLNKNREPSHVISFCDDEKMLTFLEDMEATVTQSGKHLLITHEALNLLVNSFGESKWERFIPEEIHHKPQAWQQEFIKGVLSSSSSCTIYSRHLAHGLARMMSNLNPASDVVITSPAYSEWTVKMDEQNKTHHDSKFLWTPVTEVRVKPEASAMKVFSIILKEDASFIADGFVVHCC